MIPYLNSQVTFICLLTATYSAHLIHATPVNGHSLVTSAHSEDLHSGSSIEDHKPAAVAFLSTTSNVVRRDQCTLIERLTLNTVSDQVGRNSYGIPPEPPSNQYYPYLPTTSSRFSSKLTFPIGTQHAERYKCEHPITSVDRDDERVPAATGILCSVSSPNSMMMMKIIRHVPITWDRYTVHVPARIQWEIEALIKTGRLGSPMLHQWGYWIDKTTVMKTGAATMGGSGEVYISIMKEDGFTLRNYQVYADYRDEEERKVFLTRLKQVVVMQIVRYAKRDGIFHGDLNLGNIHIIPKMHITHRPGGPPLFTPNGFEVRFTDWGYTRKVIARLETCHDPWLVPEFMVVSGDGSLRAPEYVRDYVEEVLKVPWQMVKQVRGGVHTWTRNYW